MIIPLNNLDEVATVSFELHEATDVTTVEEE